MKRLSVVLAAVSLFAGCGTVREARRVQQELAPRGVVTNFTLSAPLSLKGYSLEGLVSFALTNRPSVVTKRLAVDDARLALKALRADAPVLSDSPWTAPQLSLGGSYSESSDGASLGGGQGFRTHGSPMASVSLELLIWDFGRYDAKAAAQRARVLSAEEDLVREGYLVFQEVARTYFNYREKHALLAVALTNEAQYADHLARATARLQAGEANQLDVLKARLDLASARQTTVSYSNEVDTAGAALMYALGVDVSRGTPAAVYPVPTGYDTVWRAFASTKAPVGDVWSLARTNAPALRMAKAKLRAASHDVNYAVADLMPSVTLSGTFSWTDPLWFWSWGANAVQSLFQGFRKTTAVERATVALKSAAAEVDDAEQDLSVSLETAIANRDNAVQAIDTAKVSFLSARENLAMVRAQLAVGDVSRIELSDAIASDSTALGSFITAFYDGQRAEAALFTLTGLYPEYREREELSKEVK